MSDSIQITVTQNEVSPETIIDNAIQTTNTNTDYNVVAPEILNINVNSLCDVKADKTLTSEYDLNLYNDTTVDTTVDTTINTSVDTTINTTVHSLLEKSCEQNEDYNMGDIVWAKIGRYPFWPSVVCGDPNSGVYFKKSSKLFLYQMLLIFLH